MFAQHIFNILLLASGYALLGVGFWLSYRVQKFLDVTYALPLTAAPYVTLGLMQSAGLPLLPAGLIGITAGAVLGVTVNRFLFLPLRQRKASGLIMLLASLGLYTVFVNIISIVYGDDPVALVSGGAADTFTQFGARITVWQLLMISCAVSAMVAVTAILRLTRAGMGCRAVASDTELAGLSGVTPERAVLQAVTVASILAGLGGVVMGLDTSVDPGMGLRALFMAVVVAIIAGRRGVLGIVPASLLLAGAQVAGTWKTSTLWQDAIAFAVLLVFLLTRPRRNRLVQARLGNIGGS